MNNLSDQAKTAIEIVTAAGKKLKPYFGNAGKNTKKTKYGADIVTKLDIETEKYLFENLKKHFPSIGFRGEELGSININSGKFWLVDPIDGSAYFARGIKECTTMLALIENGKAKISIIYDFIDYNLYFAERSKGAYLNGKPIHVSDTKPKDAIVSIECLLADKNIDKFFEIHKRYDVIRAGFPAGIELAMVASGKLDARICMDAYGYDYDFAAGSLLVEEAGGKVANIASMVYDYTNTDFLAANKLLFADLTSGENPIFPISDR